MRIFERFHFSILKIMELKFYLKYFLCTFGQSKDGGREVVVVKGLGEVEGAVGAETLQKIFSQLSVSLPLS